MVSKAAHTSFLRLMLQAVFVLLVCAFTISGCRNEDGEKAFVEAVEVNELGVISLRIQQGEQGLTLESGTSSQFTVQATLKDNSQQDVTSQVSWSSADTSILTVSQSGLIQAGSTDGSTIVTVRWGDVVGTETVTVSTAALASLSFDSFPSSISECLADTQLSVLGNYADRTSNVTSLVSTWSSATTSVASINGSGLLQAHDAGTSDITASYSGVSVTETLTVADTLTAVAISPSASFDLQVGKSQAFTATATEGSITRNATNVAAFTSSDTSILAFSGDAGIATAQATSGDVTVTATCGGLTSSVVVSVVEEATVEGFEIRYDGSSLSPAGPFEVSDSGIQLQAFIVYSDDSELEVTTSDDLTWSAGVAESGTAATIDNSGVDKGEVSFTAIGRTPISAVYDNDTLRVEDEIDILVE